MQVFVTGWLAEPYEEKGTGADDDQVLACRGTYLKGFCPIVPADITLCADPGEKQTHWSVCAWSAAGEGYIFDYGTTLSPADALIIAEERVWPAVDGQQVGVTQGLIDSGDFTSEIYDVCNRTSARICPSKGTGARDGSLIRSTKEVHGLRALLYLYSDYHAKVSLYISKLQKHLPPRLWLPQDACQELPARTHGPTVSASARWHTQGMA